MFANVGEIIDFWAVEPRISCVLMASAICCPISYGSFVGGGGACE
jgi:hypothetical protein